MKGEAFVVIPRSRKRREEVESPEQGDSDLIREERKMFQWRLSSIESVVLEETSQGALMPSCQEEMAGERQC